MTLKLYNTLSKKLEVFEPLKKSGIRMYTCGPTVYDYAHIGNFRSYLFAELLRRWLEHRGLPVKQVMNITDVDDKTIRGSQLARIPLKIYTEKFEKAFIEDLRTLRIKPPDMAPKATEHIQEMLQLIQILLDRGFAYISDDGVYFNIAKFKNYGRLAKLDVEGMKPGEFSRVAADQYEKEEARDFALWKFWKPEDGDVSWDASFGKGRPGWHIECSAMSMKYLGESFDIHTGGIDLVFPHHENEIAQSEAATGKQFVKFWVHCEHLLVNGKKMSKSLGNIITLRQLVDQGQSPLALRYLLLSSHYRTQANFTFEALDDARETLNRLNDFVFKIRFLMERSQVKPNPQFAEEIDGARREFERALDNNLDTPQALAAMYGMISKANKEIDKGKADRVCLMKINDFLNLFDSVFDVLEVPSSRISEEEEVLINERERLRKQKKFKEADIIRDTLHSEGIDLEDTPYGVMWKKRRKS